MDNYFSINASPEPRSPDSSIDVKLDTAQYFHFQTQTINLIGPDGRHLLTVGKGYSQEIAEAKAFRLREQVCLVASLLGNINDTVNLPVPAVLGLADLFCQVKEGWDKG